MAAAAGQGHMSIVKLLLGHGANVNNNLQVPPNYCFAAATIGH